MARRAMEACIVVVQRMEYVALFGSGVPAGNRQLMADFLVYLYFIFCFSFVFGLFSGTVESESR
jgi:hypothetical protein